MYVYHYYLLRILIFKVNWIIVYMFQKITMSLSFIILGNSLLFLVKT